MPGGIRAGGFAERAGERIRVETMGGADCMREKFDDGDTGGGDLEEGANGSDAKLEGLGVGVGHVWEKSGGTCGDQRKDFGRVSGRVVVGDRF